jgi:hypothetical protein
MRVLLASPPKQNAMNINLAPVAVRKVTSVLLQLARRPRQRIITLRAPAVLLDPRPVEYHLQQSPHLPQ